MRPVWVDHVNNNSNVNGNNINNNPRFVRMVQAHKASLYDRLCSYENLLLAFQNARKHKTTKSYVREFEKGLKQNLIDLRTELLLHSYRPRRLQTFILRDPKTRRISKSDFRDRVVHHALCNVIEPMFDKTFIFDSYANRRDKGVLAAIKRFETFSRKVTRNHGQKGYVLKADIRRYFDTVNHTILLRILARRIKDYHVMWLIKVILSNFSVKEQGVGMPLGNLTSQFFANVFLNELDRFVKFHLRARHYLRYVDDFIIMDKSARLLKEYKSKIDGFLRQELSLRLHPEKSKVLFLHQGIAFLGFRVFPHHRLLKDSNVRKFRRKLSQGMFCYGSDRRAYDGIYDFLEGWVAYAKQASTHKLRRRVIKGVEPAFEGEVSTKEIDRMLKMIRKRPLLSHDKQTAQSMSLGAISVKASAPSP